MTTPSSNNTSDLQSVSFKYLIFKIVRVEKVLFPIVLDWCCRSKKNIFFSLLFTSVNTQKYSSLSVTKALVFCQKVYSYIRNLMSYVQSVWEEVNKLIFIALFKNLLSSLES